jgi:Cu(I)-responsive transcriptional regulator
MSMTIGEVSTKSGVPAKTIRYYEETGLISPAGRQANLYRSYDEHDVAMLRFIGSARRLGFSIEDLKSLIALYRDRTRSARDVKNLAEQHLVHVEQKIRELQSIRDALAHLIEQCSGDDRPDCPIINDLSGAEPVPVTRPHRARAPRPTSRDTKRESLSLAR